MSDILTLRVGQKVQPAAPCHSITYGFVREVWIGTEEIDGRMWAGKELARVYWPQMGGCGRWPASDLVAYGEAKS